MTTEIELSSEIVVKPISILGSDRNIIGAMKIMEEIPPPDPSDEGRIRYLMQNRHGTPFEHNCIILFVDAPIFVWREWHRHRIGFCLSGDTEIWTDSISNCGRTIRKRRLKDLCDVWNNGVKDSLGRTRFLPSVKSQRLRVLNEDTGFFELGSIENVFESGVKECLLVETEHKKGWSIRCSKDHPILTSEGWVKAGDLTGSEWVAVSGKKSAFASRQVPPSLRSGIGVWTSMQRATLIPKDADCYICGKSFHRENLVLDHVVPVVENLKLALDIDNLKPACISCHREKSDKEQVLANRCNLAASRFVRLRRKPYVVSTEMTYDITMKGPWHNFVANGIVVHNSYNEESRSRKPNKEPMMDLPDPLRTPEFEQAWAEWLAYRKRRRLPAYKTDRQLLKCARYGAEASIKAINQALDCEWQGFFPERFASEQPSREQRLRSHLRPSGRVGAPDGKYAHLDPPRDLPGQGDADTGRQGAA